MTRVERSEIASRADLSVASRGPLGVLVARARRAGLKGVVKSLRRRLAEIVAPQVDSESKPIEVRQAPPSALAVSHMDAIKWFDGRRGNYVNLAEAIRGYLPRDGVLFDVGANIGYFTKVIAEELDFTGQVHLFEPVPHLAALCEQTMRQIKVDAHIHPFGLSDRDETIDIFLADSGNLGWNTTVAEKVSAGMASIPIEVRRFDETEIKVVPNVIKIDVEGSEYLVLRGLAKVLKSWSPKPLIICEIGWGTSHPQWDSELKEFGSLTEMGYQPQNLSGEAVDLSRILKTTDILFIPPN